MVLILRLLSVYSIFYSNWNMFLSFYIVSYIVISSYLFYEYIYYIIVL